MKSVRRDDVKVTAKDLGFKVGDRFIVLSREDCYNHSVSNFEAGSVLTLLVDDYTCSPLFRREATGGEYYESFSCLSRYEEPTKAEIVLDKVKFDMVAIAQELGVPLETAHKFVQEMLFEKGCKWENSCKRVPKWTENSWLFVEDGFLHESPVEQLNDPRRFTTLGLELKKSFVVKKEATPEFIEVDGHKYALVK